jgi:4-alpha-glucanotransferase
MWVKYEPYENFPYLSVLTTSTHDMSTMRQWWQESNREDIQFYYNNLLGESGNAPEDCEPWICEKIINRHLLSTPIFSIFPIQDWLGINAKTRSKDISNDRINDPADSNNYWNFRVHKNIEELIKDTDFCSQIAQMINQSNRDSRF